MSYHKDKDDVYQTITNKMIDLLEKVDLIDYEPPFASLAAQGIPENPTTKKQYNGINIPFLWFYQQEQGYSSNHWASFKQWKDKGASVRKGEKGSTVVFYKTLLITEKDENHNQVESKVPMLRMYKVFNADQVDGLEVEVTPPVTKSEILPILDADAFCEASNVEIKHGGTRAYYSLLRDYIQMPGKEFFNDTKNATTTDNYYSTLFHELIHSTSHVDRLHRRCEKTIPHKEAYAQEELVAELGSAFLCAQFNIAQKAREDHAIYIKSWLKALRNDNKYLFKASAHAAKAVDYLNHLQTKEQETNELLQNQSSRNLAQCINGPYPESD